jgi:hypothetical protein
VIVLASLVEEEKKVPIMVLLGKGMLTEGESHGGALLVLKSGSWKTGLLSQSAIFFVFPPEWMFLYKLSKVSAKVNQIVCST